MRTRNASEKYFWSVPSTGARCTRAPMWSYVNIVKEIKLSSQWIDIHDLKPVFAEMLPMLELFYCPCALFLHWKGELT